MVLGDVLTGGIHFRVLAASLRRDDFFEDRHRRIWDAMEALDAEGTMCDRFSVGQALVESGTLESAGGLSYLCDLDRNTPSLANVDSWMRVIHDKAAVRRTMRVAQAVIDRCMAGGSASETVDWAVKALRDSAGAISGDDVLTVEQIVAEVGIEAILNPSATAGRVIPLPWEKLRWYISGLRPGQMLTIAARPGTGKSAAAGEIALHAALNGHRTALFSLEMPSQDITRRIVAGMAEVSLEDITTGHVGAGERQRCARAMQRLTEIPLGIIDKPVLSVDAIYSRLRRHQTSDPFALVIVDYLQLMDAPRAENRNQAVAELTRGLKKLAMEFGIPLVLLSQLSRDNEKQHRRPMLSDLRDSGAIEQDSDLVLFLHPVGEDGNVEFIVAKQRNGRCGKISMRLRGEYAKFEETGI